MNISADYLDGGVLRGCDHNGEDGVEDDTRDGGTVPAQGVSLWGTGDPLLRVPLLTHWASVCHLLLCLVQFRLQLHDLRHKDTTDFNIILGQEAISCFYLKYFQKEREQWLLRY